MPKNHYRNINSVHICLPIRIKFKADNSNAIPTEILTVNNFFTHWLKESDIRKYGDDLQMLPVGNSTELYKNYNPMFKHMPKKALATVNYYILEQKF